MENAVRAEVGKAQQQGTASAERIRDAAEQLEKDVTAAVEKFATVVRDRDKVVTDLMA